MERAPAGNRHGADRRWAGNHTIDFALPEPDPAPVTTIAWRIGHVGVGVLGMRAAAHFGGPAMGPYAEASMAALVLHINRR